MGRRNAWVARCRVMRSAQDRSSAAVLGWQMKIFARLALRESPCGEYGPTTWMPSRMMGIPETLPLPMAVESLLNAQERSMKVTVTVWAPALICAGMPDTLAVRAV